MARPEDIECVLFDFDGVICDTEVLGARRNMATLRRLGLDPTTEQVEALAGTAGEDSIPALLESLGSDLTYERYLEEDADGVDIYRDLELAPIPGVVRLVRSLRRSNIPVGLVSTTKASDILFALDRLHMADLFDSVVCGDMVDACKPDPACYLASMDNLGAMGSATVVFEDSPSGIAAANAAGAYVIGVKAGSVVQDTSAADESIDTFEGFSLAGR
ncbi:MAG: HAD family phosphatase [Atopobiaceae bacterium]|jgi:HAD superfamily hydrolase (TIGR01509 family)|nr:HAD family phosphatase [Atopobiaceae bacterium]MCH4179869.1 HAD family phosphatase [Atopobiaceae bacterium]MCH4213620.1 HAD family phosphatase [Atopobiaceae bacterium]MCH4229625.1 HAD family phosphatase [Atopobiaceae bacterium]MCH4276023.1 HAD family phosphatase [Atopobiaceae bacterium]